MRLISFDELKPRKGILFTRVGLKKLIAAGKFPRPIQLSPKRIASIESEIDAYIAGLAERREAA